MAKRQIGILGWEKEVHVNISIFVILALLVLVFGALFIFLPTVSERGDIEFFALAVTAAATIASGFYLGESLRIQSDQQKEAEAFGLVARWNSPDMFHARRSWHKVTETFQAVTNGGPDGVKQMLLALAEERTNHNIRYILNFFEEIAMAVKHSHADEDLLFAFFKSVIARAHEAFATWIPEHRRLTGRTDIWDQFDWICEKWHH